MTENYGIILIKILHDQYVNDFLDGDLYLNTNNYFAKTDDNDQLRFDPFEGVDESRLIKELAIADKNGDFIPIGGIINPMVTRYSNTDNINILCMYSYTDKPDDYFDKRNLGFGDTAIAITDLKEFIRRLKSAAKSVAKNVMHAPITYVDKNTHDGPMGPFRKFDNLSYQNEFRFVLSDGNGQPETLRIGCIRDITSVASPTDIESIPK
jgi:hypothetical protein